MVPQQLDDLLQSMYDEASLHSFQLDDLRERVRPYLEYVAIERRVNPREVKRFINAYTLQTLIRPELDPDTVLALQTFTFRYEWSLLYDAIFYDSTAFIGALNRYRQGEDDAFKDLLPELEDLPKSLAEYLKSPQAEPLLRHQSLDSYLSSLQETRADGFSLAHGAGFIVLAIVNELIKTVETSSNWTDKDTWTDRIDILTVRLAQSSRNASNEIRAIAQKLDGFIRRFLADIAETTDAKDIDLLANDLWRTLDEARLGLGYSVKDI